MNESWALLLLFLMAIVKGFELLAGLEIWKRHYYCYCYHYFSNLTLSLNTLKDNLGHSLFRRCSTGSSPTSSCWLLGYLVTRQLVMVWVCACTLNVSSVGCSAETTKCLTIFSVNRGGPVNTNVNHLKESRYRNIDKWPEKDMGIQIVIIKWGIELRQ